MILALVVFAAMLIQDVAASCKIRLLDGDRPRPWIAGYCEAVNDVGASLSIGIGGASVFKYGLSGQTVLIEVALILAAILGTVAGCHLTTRWARPDASAV